MSLSRGSLQVVLSAMALLAGCSAQTAYEVDGVEGRFCLPREFVVHDVPWVRPDLPDTPKGFAFQGCWHRATDSTCLFPSNLLGGVVLPSSSFKGWRWQDIDETALIRQLPSRDGTSIETRNDGGTAVVSNKRLDWNWYVWRKAVPLMDSTSFAFAEGDELLAICQLANDSSSKDGGTREMISCSRHVQGQYYALQYTFESEDRVPKNIEALDAQVFAGIDRWRCKK